MIGEHCGILARKADQNGSTNLKHGSLLERRLRLELREKSKE
jgi:hypothetical protein